MRIVGQTREGGFSTFSVSLSILLSLSALSLVPQASAQTAHTVYGLKSQGDGNSQQRNSVLFTVTPTMPTPVTGTLNAVTTASVTLSGAGVLADGLAINSRLELFAYVNSALTFTPSGSTAQLVSINKDTGVATTIGSALANAWITGAAFDMDDRLWILSWQTGPVQQLIEVDPTDGSMIGSPINVTGISLPNAPTADIAFDSNNQAYLSTGNSTNATVPSVFELNVTSGAATSIYTFPTSMTSTNGGAVANGMAFYRNDEAWFAQATGIDRVIYAPSIALLSSAHNIVTNLTTDTNIGNSGALDLAARPNRVTALDDTASTVMNTPVTISMDSLLINDDVYWKVADTNVPSDILSVSTAGTLPITTWPKSTANGGTVTVSGNDLIYTPNTGFIGTDTFTYRAVAGDGSWAEATVTITVLATPGTITVTKTITGAPATIITTDLAFPFAVACQNPSATYNGTVTVLANTSTGSTDVTSIPAGSSNCLITEGTLPAGPAGYAWAAPSYVQPNPAALPAASHVTGEIINGLTQQAPAVPVPVNALWLLLLTTLALGASAGARIVRQR